ncbi:MAG TPA: hypothetical protein VGM53_22560 [Streptosporangiaceae bacterium]|jgi:hypothetical protein
MLSQLGISTRPTRRAAVAAAAGAVAAVLAAGCSAGSGLGPGASHQAAGGLSPTRAITLAAQQAQRVNSASYALSVRLSGATSAAIVSRVQMRIRPSVAMNLDVTSLSEGGHNVPGGMQEIVNGKTLYLKLALLQHEFGKPWLAIPFSQIQQVTGLNLGQMIQQAQANNPLVQTQMLAVSKNVKAAGTQSIDGVATTEYTGSYPVSAGLAKLPASLRSMAEQQMRQLGITDMTFRVWIDGQHMTRKLVAHAAGTSEQMTVQAQVTGINQTATISTPPRSQVATIPTSKLKG